MDKETLALLEEGIKEGFLTLDAKMRERHELDEDSERSGTTAICAIVTPSHIVLANLGKFYSFVDCVLNILHCLIKDEKLAARRCPVLAVNIALANCAKSWR